MPTRAEVIQRAQELYFTEQYRSGIMQPNTPEDSELLEGGFYHTALSELMCDSPSRAVEQYSDYIEQCENLEKKFIFDIETALTQGTTICGNRGTGKTSLAKTFTISGLEKRI